MLIFRDTNEKFELEQVFLKTKTDENFNVELADLLDKKLIFEFAKEMNFDEKALGKKSTRDKTLIRLLDSPFIMAKSLQKESFSYTRWPSYNYNEFCDRLKLFLQDKKARTKSILTDEKNVSLAGNLLEDNCISTKNHSTPVQMFL